MKFKLKRYNIWNQRERVNFELFKIEPENIFKANLLINRNLNFYHIDDVKNIFNQVYK